MPEEKKIQFVKQADTWHVVDEEAKPDPKERRPHLRAKCGAKLHMGTFDDPAVIDEKPLVCGDQATRLERAALLERIHAGIEERVKEGADRALLEAQIPAELAHFCTGD